MGELIHMAASAVLYIVIMLAWLVIRTFPWQTLAVILTAASIMVAVYGIALYLSAPFLFPWEDNFYVNFPARWLSAALFVLLAWGAIIARQKAIDY